MSHDEGERERARAIILQRRAALVAYAVAAGVTMPACEARYCLSPVMPGGGASVGGSGGTSAGSGGATSGFGGRVCLTAGYGFGGTPPVGGATVCLSPPIGGQTVCLSPPFGGRAGGGGGGEGGLGGDAGEGGLAGEGGTGGESEADGGGAGGEGND